MGGGDEEQGGKLSPASGLIDGGKVASVMLRLLIVINVNVANGRTGSGRSPRLLPLSEESPKSDFGGGTFR